MKTTTAILTLLLAASTSANAILILSDHIGDTGRGDYASAPVYDAVFRGTIVDVRDRSGGGETITFQIVKVIDYHPAAKEMRLDSLDLIDVVSDGRYPHCFLDFEMGTTYTVYSQLEGGSLVTDACLGTHPYRNMGSITRDHALYPPPWDEPTP